MIILNGDIDSSLTSSIIFSFSNNIVRDTLNEDKLINININLMTDVIIENNLFTNYHSTSSDQNLVPIDLKGNCRSLSFKNILFENVSLD